MLKTIEVKRTNGKAPSAVGNGKGAQSLKQTTASYHAQVVHVKRLAELAVELAKIELLIKENQSWMHAQPCGCEQCSAVFAELLKLSRQRQRVLSEIIKLST